MTFVMDMARKVAALAAGAMVAGTSAAYADTGPPPEASPWPACSSCLAAFDVDLDGDGQPDRVELNRDRRLRLYYIHVRTRAGRLYRPFTGSFDGPDGKLSLSLRTGTGDLRCREWVEGHNCGYFTTAHDTPSKVLYLTDGKRGDFVIYMVVTISPTPRGTPGPRRDEYFVVMPALEGAPTKELPRWPAGEN